MTSGPEVTKQQSSSGPTTTSFPLYPYQSPATVVSECPSHTSNQIWMPEPATSTWGPDCCALVRRAPQSFSCRLRSFKVINQISSFIATFVPSTSADLVCGYLPTKCCHHHGVPLTRCRLLCTCGVLLYLPYLPRLPSPFLPSPSRPSHLIPSYGSISRWGCVAFWYELQGPGRNEARLVAPPPIAMWLPRDWCGTYPTLGPGHFRLSAAPTERQASTLRRPSS